MPDTRESDPTTAGRARPSPGAVLVIVVVLLAVYSGARAYRTAARQEHDFCTYYLASTDAKTGGLPYRDREKQSPFIYPPLLLWLVTPLTRLDLQVAAVVWAQLTILAWIVTVLATRRAVPAGGVGPTVLLVLPSVLSLRFVLRELGLGQVNLIVLAFVALGFLALTRRREIVAGCLVATAATLKILPAAFFLPLLVWSRWRALLAGALFVPFLFLVPVVTYGPEAYSRILDGFIHGRLLTHATDLAFDTHMANQSLFATASRWLTDVSPLPPGYPRIHFAVCHRSLEWVAALTAAVSLALLAGLALALFRVRHRPALWSLGFALVFVTVHLISKKTWEEHLVTMLFTFAAILADGARPRGRRVLAAAAALEWIHAPIWLGRDLSDRVQALGPTTLSLVVLWIYLFARLSLAPEEPACDPARASPGSPADAGSR